jgi:DNA repair protein RecO
MLAVVYERSGAENGSLLLKVFTANGKVKKLKIPGILKSKTRNAYFLAPATLWDFTISGNERETITPKEYSLVHSPYDFNTSYRELTSIGEMIKPLNCLKPELEAVDLFNDLTETLYNWKCGDEALENIYINQFYFKFLLRMGLLHHSPQCIHCGKNLSEHDRYHLFSGSICEECLKGQAYRENELIPNRWVGDGISGVSASEKYEKKQEIEFRQKILIYLKNSV